MSNKNRSRSRVLIITAALTVVVGSGALGAESTPVAGEDGRPKESEEKKPPKGGAQEPKTYTNEDLERLFGKAAATAEVPKEEPPAVPAVDPIEVEAKREASEAGTAALLEAAERRLVRARGRVTEAERRVLAVRNPLLAPPAAPAGLEETWSRMPGPERLKAAQDELAAAREELSAAEERARQLKSAAR